MTDLSGARRSHHNITIPDTQAAAARRRVADHARDVADARMLLDMLGLLDDQDGS